LTTNRLVVDLSDCRVADEAYRLALELINGIGGIFSPLCPDDIADELLDEWEEDLDRDPFWTGDLAALVTVNSISFVHDRVVL